MSTSQLEKIVAWAKRRGFVFPSSEIYGGLGSCYDYGPYGVLLKNNIKEAWWKAMVFEREEIVGLDSAILLHPKTWEASGHLANFVDQLVECKNCHKRYRQDEATGSCPACGGKLTKPADFNLLMKTYLGPVEDKASLVFLRPETCQGIYLNFKNVLATARKKLPFGIAQIGKAFRNEITPGNFIFRMREFEQMEMQFFVPPAEASRWFEFWVKERVNWYYQLGMKKTNLRFRRHKKEELPHYAKEAGDIEYHTPFGWKEIEGIHNRGDWDLSRHAQFSGANLKYEGEYYPFVIETSAGADRLMLAFILDAFEEVKGGRTTTTKATKEEEIILHLHPCLAPIKVAVLPLVRKLQKPAQQVYQEIRKQFWAEYDEDGSIGRRYRRQDEIGTPFCVTIDFQTLDDQTVTIRDRDTMKQERVAIKQLSQVLSQKLG